MSKYYDLVYVDKDNDGNGLFKRVKKKSYNWYKEYLDGKAIPSN